VSDAEALLLAFDDSPLAGAPVFARHLAFVPSIQAPPLREDVRRAALRGWEDRVRAEYRGMILVRRFHALTVEVNAPADLQELALAMVLQEQQHARLCAAAVRSLGGSGEIAFAPDELAIGEAPLRSHQEELLRAIVGTYAISEVVALALIRHAIGVLPHGGYREVLRRVARDEVLHGGAAAALRARDVIEPDEAALFEDPEAAVQLPLAGIPDSRGFRAVYDAALAAAEQRALAAVRGDQGSLSDS
jgi:hypothetical protein